MPTAKTRKDRFERVAAAARENMQVAVDLILLHNETRVKGPQVRSSLNKAMIVTAVGTWERFIADTHAAFTVTRGWMTPGRFDSVVADAYGANAEAKLVAAGACGAYTGAWRATAGAGWAGLKITPRESLSGSRPGARTGLTLLQHLDQWVELRNGLAHQQVRQTAHTARDARRWALAYGKRRGRSDPYKAQNGRRVLWESRAGSDTIQAGAARAGVALLVQVLDYTIYEVATRNAWDPDALRLPSEWFTRTLPPTCRGLKVGELH